MRKEGKQFLYGLLTHMLVGLVLALIFLWFTGKSLAMSAAVAGGFGLFYLHRRWLKKINRSEGDVKIKSIGG